MKREVFPFKAEKGSLSEVLSDASHTPTEKKWEQERSRKFGTWYKPRARTVLALKKDLHSICNTSVLPFWILQLRSSSTPGYFKTVFLLYSNTVQIGNLIVILLFLSLSRLLLWWNNFRHTKYKSIKSFPYSTDELLWVVKINFIPPVIHICEMFRVEKWRLRITQVKCVCS